VGAFETSASYMTLGTVTSRFAALSQEVDGAGDVIGTGHDEGVEASGEFTSSVRDGATHFLLSWGAALEVCASSAQLVSRNAALFAEGLHGADAALGTEIKL
jgi:hypothetical protein